MCLPTAPPCRTISQSTVVLSINPRDRYQQLVKDGTIDNDRDQVVIVDALQRLHSQLDEYVPSTRSPSLLKRVSGVYMCLVYFNWNCFTYSLWVDTVQSRKLKESIFMAVWVSKHNYSGETIQN